MTKIPKWIFGPRSVSDSGVYIAKEDGNALTDDLSELLFYIDSGMTQIVQIGVAQAPFPLVVLHDLGYIPFVFPSIVASSFFLDSGFIRPYDLGPSPWTVSSVVCTDTDLTINQTGLAIDVNYMITNQRALG